VHCLAFFEKDNDLFEFQNYLDEHLPKIENDVKKFGYQVVVDREENIVEQINWLLISALDVSINQIEKKVHDLNGLFIPAHIDRARYSILSQLGFVPTDLKYDALELSKFVVKDKFVKENNYLSDNCFIQSSDAHYINDVGSTTSNFYMNSKSFKETVLALKGMDGRKVMCDE